ncbi:MAG TPA: ATP-binding protein [Solirubrobacteraceae bacterium]|nr:ATP-binding protein [Solirubrobacteraceae bacterium]
MNDERTSYDVWGAAIALQAALAMLLGLVLIFIWGLTGAGYFWPKWVLFGLAVALTIQLAIRLALRVGEDRQRALALHAAASGWIAAVLLAVYALAGGGTFWPLWAVATLGLALGAHAIVVVALPRLRPQERELEARVDVLTRTRAGALDVQAAELRRIERDLHDGAQARLVALSMQLGRAEERLEGQPEIADFVRRAREEAGAAIGELRDLARGIAPPVLADRGLVAAVEALGVRAQIPVTVDASIRRRPLPVIETAAYFVVAEALTNAAKHAGGAAATVELADHGDRLVVEVHDDGPGGADASGTGLMGLRHRVAALDGTLTVSSPAGGGTTVRAELPCGW